MTNEQKKYYILGLEDAIKELEMEIECCEMELTCQALITSRYALRNGISLIQDLIRGVENNL